jgi:hypothetical protein
MKPTLPRIIAAAAFLTTVGAQAATFQFEGTLRSSDNTSPPVEPLITVTGIDFFSFKRVDNGLGHLTAFDGFSSLMGIAPADITFAFGDLELESMVLGGGIGTQVYGEIDASPRYFDLFVQGVKVATGGDFGLTIVTDTDSGSPNFTLSTGTGTVTLQEVGGHSFVSELQTLQGDSVLRLDISSFVSPVIIFNDRSVANFNDYTIGGGGVAVPEPSSIGLLALGGCLVGWKSRQHRRG